MPSIKPFHALRPAPSLVERVIVAHKDAVDTAHAKAEMDSNPYSFLHISRVGLTLDEKDSENYDLIKERTASGMQDFIDRKILIRDKEECLYIYRLSLRDHIQTGLVACIDVNDYSSGKIKRHELTRDIKVRAQERLLEASRFNTEPVLLTFDSDKYGKPDLIKYTEEHDPVYHFTDSEGITHEIWPVSEPVIIRNWERAFDMIDAFYIADGHHRIAAAAEYSKHNDDNERYLMAVLFPSDEMQVFDYNRAVSDLNKMSSDEFINALDQKGFTVEKAGTRPVRPSRPREFTMYLDRVWYRLHYRNPVDESDPVSSIDISILQDYVIRDILGIAKPQSDERLAFISGTKGINALERTVTEGYRVAFAIPPADIKEVMRVADHKLTMPPKSTCFEPKPVSGLILHSLDPI